MKKFCSLISVVLVLVFLLVSSGIYRKNRLCKYQIEAEVEENMLSGKVLIDYIAKDNMQDICLCLYPNAFLDQQNVCEPQLFDFAYPEKFDDGWINISDVKVNGCEAERSFESNDQILKIHNETKVGKNIKIEISFNEKLPKSPMRYGYYDDTYNFGNWYPILCPIENGNYVKSVYCPWGDPFYSQVSNYSVKLTVPSNMRIASTGKIYKSYETPIKKTYEIKASKVRDFAFVLSEKFEVTSKKIGNTIVYAYSTTENGKKMLDIGVSALEYFNKTFDTYPYSTLSLVESDFYIGGMEYPNLVLISDQISDYELEQVCVHEIAHQWWYGIVGNDEVNCSWLDEGLTQYSTALYLGEKHNKYDDFVNDCANYFAVVNQAGNLSNSFNKALNEFSSWADYDALIYNRTVVILDEIACHLGREKFLNLLREFYSENKFKTVNTNDFLSKLRKKTVLYDQYFDQ